ncbi:inosine/xanthosine triphosphatase [Methanococcus maripaludis]|uniref:Probable inosine/xanthosine triphosphatase n=1 Tax=Methanococcus maripaludis TaxID=39152 RepID=A0A7J9NZF7_METMI|nr:inosine/xanthosine triphosphatase [Methanococcus maripaludis]MBA2853079.1 inosine/xanthosine triphosphatase [Methanococcus maripaludis]
MFESRFCDICGKPAKTYRFGSLLCEDPECLKKAQKLRGGPAGHKLRVISVGSTNPIKVSAVEKAIEKTVGTMLVTPVDIESGVSDQPIGFEETFKGAYNRAKSAFEKVNCVYGIGIEAGTVELGDKKLDIHICVVYNGLDYSVGTSQAFQIPKDISDRINEGYECSKIAEETYGVKNIGQKNGIIGVLTDNNILREQLCIDSVVMAMIPKYRRNSQIRF